jgi:hypothetical protein
VSGVTTHTGVDRLQTTRLHNDIDYHSNLLAVTVNNDSTFVDSDRSRRFL